MYVPGSNNALYLDNSALYLAQNTSHTFHVDRGRAEPIRMMMIEAGIPYTEKSFNKATWPSHKDAGIKSGLYTYGQGLFE